MNNSENFEETKIDDDVIDLYNLFVGCNKKENEIIQMNVASNCIKCGNISFRSCSKSFDYALKLFRKNEIPIEWNLSNTDINKLPIQQGDMLYYEETVYGLEKCYEEIAQFIVKMLISRITIKVYICFGERLEMCKNLARIGRTHVICMSDLEKFEFDGCEELE